MPARNAVQVPPDTGPSPKTFALLLGVLVVLAAYPVALLGQTFIIRDFGYFGYPLAYYHKQCLWAGEIPLWNPLSCTGLPFAAQWNTLVFYPGSFIYLLLPLPWSLSLFGLVHQYLAGLGMYFLARRWSGRQLAAAVAGIAFAFNGLTVNCLLWPNNVAALAWMPWLVWLVERAWRNGGRDLLWATLAGTLQMLSGAPEIILLTWVAIVIFWLTALLRTGRRHWLSLLLRPAAVVGWITALSAVQLLPFLDLLERSDRSAGYADSLWAMPAWGWVNFLLPFFGYHRTLPGIWYQHGQEWTLSYYAGIGIVGLAILALGLVRHRRVQFLGALALVALLLAMGTDGVLYPALRRLFPPLGFVRFQIKFVVLVAFALCLLASLGVRAALASTDYRRRAVAVVALLGLLVTALVWIGCTLQYAPPLPIPPQYYLDSNHFRPSLYGACQLAFVALALALLGGAASWARRPATIQRARWAGTLLLLILWVDLVAAQRTQNPTVNANCAAPGLLLAQQDAMPNPPRLGLSRAYVDAVTTQTIGIRMISDISQDYLCHRLLLFGNANLLDQVPLVDGFFSLYLPAQRQVWETLFYPQTNAVLKPLGDFLGVTHLPSRTNMFAWVNRSNALPIVTGGQDPVFVERNAALARLCSNGFDPRRQVLLPPESEPAFTSIRPTPVLITNLQFSAHRISFSVRSDAPAAVVLAQTWYHPWRATVEGQPVPIWRANHAFQALTVPPGTSRVELRYIDWTFRVGALISLMALAAWILALFRIRRAPKSCQAKP